MSTKYFGYRIKNTNIVDVFNQIRNQKTEMYQILIDQLKEDFVDYFYERIDRGKLIGSGKKVISKSMFDIKFDFINYQQNTFPYDVLFCLFPYKQDVLIMNCGDSIYECVLKNISEVEDYSYWDNTDKPDDISDEEWNYRKDVWNEVCPDCPANDCLMFKPAYYQLTTYDILRWSYNDLKEYIIKRPSNVRLKNYNKFAMYMKKSKNIFHDIQPEQLCNMTEADWNNRDKQFLVSV